MTDQNKKDEILKLTHELDGYTIHSPARVHEIVKEIRRLVK